MARKKHSFNYETKAKTPTGKTTYRIRKDLISEAKSTYRGFERTVQRALDKGLSKEDYDFENGFLSDTAGTWVWEQDGGPYLHTYNINFTNSVKEHNIKDSLRDGLYAATADMREYLNSIIEATKPESERERELIKYLIGSRQGELLNSFKNNIESIQSQFKAWAKQYTTGSYKNNEKIDNIVKVYLDNHPLETKGTKIERESLAKEVRSLFSKRIKSTADESVREELASIVIDRVKEDAEKEIDEVVSNPNEGFTPAGILEAINFLSSFSQQFKTMVTELNMPKDNLGAYKDAINFLSDFDVSNIALTDIAKKGLAKAYNSSGLSYELAITSALRERGLNASAVGGSTGYTVQDLSEFQEGNVNDWYSASDVVVKDFMKDATKVESSFIGISLKQRDSFISWDEIKGTKAPDWISNIIERMNKEYYQQMVYFFYNYSFLKQYPVEKSSDFQDGPLLTSEVESCYQTISKTFGIYYLVLNIIGKILNRKLTAEELTPENLKQMTLPKVLMDKKSAVLVYDIFKHLSYLLSSDNGIEFSLVLNRGQISQYREIGDLKASLTNASGRITGNIAERGSSERMKYITKYNGKEDNAMETVYANKIPHDQFSWDEPLKLRTSVDISIISERLMQKAIGGQ